MALKFSFDPERWVRRAATAAIFAALTTLIYACAGGPAPAKPAPTANSPGPAAQAGTEPKTAASASSPGTQPSGPAAYFVDAQGARVPADRTVNLPTGAPPAGRIFPRSDDASAVIYVTIDSTIPTETNNWAVFKTGETGRYISSLEAKSRTYRIVAGNTAKGTGPVSTYVVNWTDEDKPQLAAPRFEANGTQIAPGKDVTLPTGGDSNPAGRLAVTCNYLGATLYITNDGSEPSPKNFWKSDICDGTYIFASNAFTASYKVMAVLRSSQSPVTEVKVTWKAQ